ncbi:MAG: ParA family protein [Pseudobdellovibrionaceae bacterium]|jgi:chromosome partitioning protein
MAQKTTNDFLLSLLDLAELVGRSPEAVSQDIEKAFGPQRLKSLVLPQIVRRYLSSQGYQFQQRVISFQMLKGGVAKTTSALNLGIRAAQYGYKVLFIDLDQQANLTFALGCEDEDQRVFVDVLERKCSFNEAVRTVDEYIDLLPSSLNNSVLDRVLMQSHRNLATAVKNPLAEVKARYDLMIIDTAPNLSAINTAVTCASDQVVLPINPDKFSLIGLKKNLEDLREIENEFQVQVDKRILFTKFDGRETTSKEILSYCLETFEDLLLKNYIRSSSEIKNSIRSNRHLFSAKSNAKADYEAVTRELLGWEKEV